MADRIEQIARAIYDRTVEIHKTGPILEFSVDEAGFYMVIARAAYLATLRSITDPEVMTEVIAAVCKGSEMPGIRLIATGILQAGIDHLIAEASE